MYVLLIIIKFKIQEHSLNPVSKNAENLFSASPLQPPESSEGAALVVNAGASAAATVTGIAADASSKKKQPRTELNCITHDDLRHELDRIRGKLQEIHDMIARAERSAQTRKLVSRFHLVFHRMNCSMTHLYISINFTFRR